MKRMNHVSLSGLPENVALQFWWLRTVKKWMRKGPESLDLPGYRLHPLRGDLKGFWSVEVSGNWRIIFRFENENVYDVDLIDYH